MSDQYIVVSEFSTGIFGIPVRVEADSDREAAEKFPYASRGGVAWVIPVSEASAWRVDGRMVPADD